MKTIKALEKEIDKIREGCNKELGEDYQELCCGEDFHNEESESGGSFILCQECREKFFKLEAELQTLKEVLKLINQMFKVMPESDEVIKFRKWEEELKKSITGK